MKTCIIYENNSETGKLIAAHLAKNSFHVIMASGNENDKTWVKEIKSSTNSIVVEWKFLNISSQESIREFAQWVIEKFRYLNLVIYFESQSGQQPGIAKTNGSVHKLWRHTNNRIVKLNDLLNDLLKIGQFENRLFILKKKYDAKGSLPINSIAYSYNKETVDELVK